MLAIIRCRIFCLPVYCPENVKIKTYWSIIFPVVVYGYETWSLTLREECRLRVFENKVVRRIFGPKRNEVTGEWRRLYNEEIYPHQMSVGCQVKKIEMGRACSTHGEEERCIQGFSGGNLREGDDLKDPGVDGRIIFKRVLREMGWEDMGWIDLTQYRDSWRALVNAVMNLRVS